MTNNQDQMLIANDLLKQSRWKEAGSIFRQLWEKGNNAYAASLYLRCLRKAGYCEASIKQGKVALDQFPDNKYIKNELVWAYYDHLIKPEEAKENLTQLIKSAEKILSLQPEPMPKELTVFAVIKVAKQKEQWEIVSKWCDHLNSQTISTDTFSTGDHKGKSKKEQWFFAKVKSLIELKQWKEARSWALAASSNYPMEIQFHRWSALALGYQGEEFKAIEEFQVLIIKFTEEWYILQDISELYSKINQPEMALHFACRSALSQGEDKLKVSLYESIAKQSLFLNKIEMAGSTLGLCKAVRQQEGWSIKPSLQQLEFNIRQKFEEQQLTWKINLDLGELKKLCQKFWKNEVYSDQTRHYGVIDSLPPDKKHGWILRDDGNRIFFLQRELPPHLRKERLKVSFLLKKGWDRKKDRASDNAVEIRVINS
jgi:tetratricopeptide (TPR) repeat protein